MGRPRKLKSTGREGWALNGRGVLVPPEDPTHPLASAVEASTVAPPPEPAEGPLREIKAFKRKPPGIVLILADCLHEIVMRTPHFDGNPVPCPECGKSGQP